MRKTDDIKTAGVRVSGGDLCVAEAPTEPTGEKQDPALLFVFIYISRKDI